MLQVICTSYTKTKDGLVLRNNWIEEFYSREEVIENLQKFEIDLSDWLFPEKGLSGIVEGKMSIPNVVIHCRILKF